MRDPEESCCALICGGRLKVGIACDDERANGRRKQTRLTRSGLVNIKEEL
jgi:hypothetical protein